MNGGSKGLCARNFPLTRPRAAIDMSRMKRHRRAFLHTGAFALLGGTGNDESPGAFDAGMCRPEGDAPGRIPAHEGPHSRPEWKPA